MKKMMLAFVGLFMMSTMVFAQECDKKKCDGCCKNKAEFAQKRTEKMAERYGLNEEQKAKVLALNTEFFSNVAKLKGDSKKEEIKKCCDAKKEGAEESCDKAGKCNKKVCKCDKKECKSCCKDACKCDKKEKSCCKDGDKCDKKECKSCCKDACKCDKKEGKSCDKKCDKDSKCGADEAVVAKMKEEVAKYKANLKAIFTAEQYAQFENDIKERVAKCGSCKK